MLKKFHMAHCQNKQFHKAFCRHSKQPQVTDHHNNKKLEWRQQPFHRSGPLNNWLPFMSGKVHYFLSDDNQMVRPTLDMVTFQMATSEPMQPQNKGSWIWKAHTKPWMRWTPQMIPVMTTNHHFHPQLPPLPTNLHFNLQPHQHLPHLHLHYHHISV